MLGLLDVQRVTGCSFENWRSAKTATKLIGLEDVHLVHDTVTSLSLIGRIGIVLFHGQLCGVLSMQVGEMSSPDLTILASQLEFLFNQVVLLQAWLPLNRCACTGVPSTCIAAGIAASG